MKRRQPSLPFIWIISDARNDCALERALKRLPRGSGLIFRHYHLHPEERRARWNALSRISRARGHRVVLAGPVKDARRWLAEGSYGPVRMLSQGPATMRLATAHSLREIAHANRARADAVLLSPVFPTRSHPGAATLGPVRFRLLAARSLVPVIALGGMGAGKAKRLRCPRWAAIDSFEGTPTVRTDKDS